MMIPMTHFDYYTYCYTYSHFYTHSDMIVLITILMLKSITKLILIQTDSDYYTLLFALLFRILLTILEFNCYTYSDISYFTLSDWYTNLIVIAILILITILILIRITICILKH